MWSLEQIDILKKLWNRGEPARIIALQLRTTRNAVIGKANRLGLPKHPSRHKEVEYKENIKTNEISMWGSRQINAGN